MITQKMTNQEIFRQMQTVADESTVIAECVRKFGKMCRKLPKGKVTLTRRFVHKPDQSGIYLELCPV